MAKKLLKIPGIFNAVLWKKMDLIQLRFDDELPDRGWDVLREIAKANSMTLTEICSEYEPFIYCEFAELKVADVDLSDVAEIREV